MNATPHRGSRCGVCYWALYDGDWCQNPKCVMRGKCSGCEGRGEVGGQFPDGSYQTDPCQHCEGNGFVEIPELPSGIESQTHNIEFADAAKPCSAQR